MAQKDKLRPKRPAAQKPVAAMTKAHAARLQAENARLAEQIATAEARIAMLERQRDEALNRIEWVIDSIHSLAESVR
jgi:chromosome segregation ATPase